MNGTRAHRRAQGAAALLALSLAVATWPAPTRGDDGNLTHRLEADQNRSSFQQKLERIREQARERAAQEPDTPSFSVERPDSPPGYHGSQRLRLTPEAPAEADAAERAPPGTRATDAGELAERRQRQLEQSQRERALNDDLPPGAERPGRADFETRQEQRKFRTEQRSEAFHRKLMR